MYLVALHPFQPLFLEVPGPDYNSCRRWLSWVECGTPWGLILHLGDPVSSTALPGGWLQSLVYAYGGIDETTKSLELHVYVCLVLSH